jgi:hypothetical protein
MPKKKNPAPVRVVVDNAEPVRPPGNENGPRTSSRPSPPPLPPDCPVIPIGIGEGVRYYLNASRQLVALAVKDHTRLQILGLFGEHADMVHEIWPRRREIKDREGNITGYAVVGRPEDAAEQLLRLTAPRGCGLQRRRHAGAAAG